LTAINHFELQKGLTDTIASYPKFPCVKDLVFLHTIIRGNWGFQITTTPHEVYIVDSVRRSLFKHNSAAGKDLYSSGGQKNTLAQVSMYDPVRRSLSNITLPWSSAFTLLVDE
jgi:hypothetical protein